MKTTVITPQEIFYNPTRLVVPLFQRPYVWSKETQWQPLWDDIVRLVEVISNHDEAGTHFLGAIVTQQVPSGLGSIPAANVIDGQQRLTTVQLLLDALHSELERRGYTRLAGQVLPLIENPENSWRRDEDRYKVWPTNRDRDAFATVMSVPVPVDYDGLAASRMRDGHRFFAEQIAGWLDADPASAEDRAWMLVPAIKDRLQIASISLDANEDAQAIFETLNARGTPLSAADLVKNFLFQQIPEKEAEQAYLANWADFETPWWEKEITSGRVKNPRASLFLWQWLVARTLDDFPIREVFTQFKHYVNTVAKDVSALLPQIKRAADRYRSLSEGAERQDGRLSRAELFNYRVGTLDSDVARPLLIWLDESEQAEIPDSDRVRILEILESWFVRRALVRAPSQGSNRFLVDLLKHLSRQPKDGVADALQQYLTENHTTVTFWPGDAEVRAVLATANFYGGYRRARVRMVLEALEDARRGYPGDRPLAMGPIVRERGTIEHLMPQTWRAHWTDPLTEVQAIERDQIVQRLGNLTLVTQSLNSKVSNGTWAAKSEHFRRFNDVLITNDALAASGEGAWDEQQIADRTEALIEQILAIWPAPEGHVGQLVPAAVTASTTVDLAQLVSSGWIEPATRIVFTLSGHEGRVADIAQDGRVFLDEVAYDTPSGAGREIASRSVNGWWYWSLATTGQRLSEIRDAYTASMGEDDSAEEEADEGGISPAALAVLLGVDGRSIRRFLRSITPKEEQPGSGGRWSIDPAGLDALRAQFAEFEKGRKGKVDEVE
ncbi:MAG: DUF262 domain-containing protein [Actinobacteria bacterium]|nr:DUF262 domain-containing protein [Actinomycetota bacterium]